MPYVSPQHCAACGHVLAVLPGKPGQRLCDGGCGEITYLSPIPVVAAIVEHPTGIVLVRSPGWPDDWYGLVTGFLEPNESPQDAILREVREELSVDGSVAGLIGAYSFPEMNQVIIAFHVRVRGEIVLDRNELADFRLVQRADLVPWDFGTGPAVRDFLAA
jgi:NAD+ diphosphatase